MELKDTIKTMREERGWTQQQLADKLGVTRSAVTQWETGWSQPKMDSIKKLADVFGTTIASITDAQPDFDGEQFNLTEDEIELIRKYRRLSTEDKQTVIRMAARLGR